MTFYLTWIYGFVIDRKSSCVETWRKLLVNKLWRCHFGRNYTLLSMKFFKTGWKTLVDFRLFESLQCNFLNTFGCPSLVWPLAYIFLHQACLSVDPSFWAMVCRNVWMHNVGCLLNNLSIDRPVNIIVRLISQKLFEFIKPIKDMKQFKLAARSKLDCLYSINVCLHFSFFSQKSPPSFNEVM